MTSVVAPEGLQLTYEESSEQEFTVVASSSPAQAGTDSTGEPARVVTVSMADDDDDDAAAVGMGADTPTGRRSTLSRATTLSNQAKLSVNDLTPRLRNRCGWWHVYGPLGAFVITIELAVTAWLILNIVFVASPELTIEGLTNTTDWKGQNNRKLARASGERSAV